MATAELADAGRRVILVDQEPEASLAGLGGDRRLRAPEDEWPRKWSEAYVDFTAGEKRA